MVSSNFPSPSASILFLRLAESFCARFACFSFRAADACRLCRALCFGSSTSVESVAAEKSSSGGIGVGVSSSGVVGSGRSQGQGHPLPTCVKWAR